MKYIFTTLLATLAPISAYAVDVVPTVDTGGNGGGIIIGLALLAILGGMLASTPPNPVTTQDCLIDGKLDQCESAD